LTSRWGSLDSDTSRNRYAVTDVPDYFVIDDLGAPLADSTGLFVHTATANETAYYAVTTLVNGVENRTVTTGLNTAAVQEFVATPQPVLTLSVNGGKGRLYTHYMDYQQWNPTLNGYAFSYFVALPYNYNASRSYPLQVELHAYGYYPTLLEEVRYQWQVVQLIPIDPGDSLDTYHTWWYGHARDHDYANDGNLPFDGAIENFTQQRVMKAIQEIIDNPGINIDTDLIHAYGNSMGASGSVSLALHYPSVVSGIYASQPMMNYETSSRFRFNFERLFGSTDRNLPIVNNGLYSQSIRRYGEAGSQPTGVWDWMDHHQQVQRRRGDDFAYLMIDFGKADDIIDWQTQGAPTFSALNNAAVAYTATAREGVGHEWRAFDAVNQNLFAFEVGGWSYANTLSYPALNFASGSGRINPPSSGDDEYQTTLEWSTPQYGFGQSIIDQSNRYEVTVRAISGTQLVNITPRNTQSFRPASGTSCDWSARNVNTGATESGSVTVDGNGLVTVPQVTAVGAGGTRLSINCS
ncbi:MAG: alpha/beta hydrolase-fold protein, partial [Pseudomonadota bacterium]